MHITSINMINLYLLIRRNYTVFKNQQNTSETKFKHVFSFSIIIRVHMHLSIKIKALNWVQDPGKALDESHLTPD